MALSKRSRTPKPADQADEPNAESSNDVIRLDVDKAVESIERKQFNTAQLETIHQYWADIHKDLSAKLSNIPLETRNKYLNLESIVSNYLEYLEAHYEAMTEEMHRMISILKPKHPKPSNPPPDTLKGTKELMDSLRLVIYHARKAADSLNDLIDKIEMKDSERLERKRENTKLFMEATENTTEFFKTAHWSWRRMTVDVSFKLIGLSENGNWKDFEEI